MTNQDLVEKINNEEIGGICIDTNVLVSEGRRSFESKRMRSLSEKTSDNFVLVLPDILVGEMLRHCIKRHEDRLQDIRSAINTLERCGVEEGLIDSLRKYESPAQNTAAIELQEFKERTKHVEISAEDHVCLNTLIRMYFEPSAPFGTARDKKSEFPDALALLALDGWAKQTEASVICISSDSDWEAFCDTTDGRLICHKNLTSVLSAITQTHEASGTRTDSFLAILSSALHQEGGLRSELSEHLQFILDNGSVYAEASTNYRCEAYVEHATILSLEVASPDAELSIISFEDDGVEASISLALEIEFIVNVDFYVHDPIDRNELLLDSQYFEHTENVEVEAIAQFANMDEPYLESVECIDLESLSIDLGYLELDMSESDTYS